MRPCLGNARPHILVVDQDDPMSPEYARTALRAAASDTAPSGGTNTFNVASQPSPAARKMFTMAF
eukprot:1452960-Rhodomonas_salina.2